MRTRWSILNSNQVNSWGLYWYILEIQWTPSEVQRLQLLQSRCSSPCRIDCNIYWIARNDVHAYTGKSSRRIACLLQCIMQHIVRHGTLVRIASYLDWHCVCQTTPSKCESVVICIIYIHIQHMVYVAVRTHVHIMYCRPSIYIYVCTMGHVHVHVLHWCTRSRGL